MKLTKQQMEVKLNLLETAAIFDKGGLQNDVRAKFGDTMGQKLWFILLLDRRFPTVELIKRLTDVEITSPRFLKFNKIRGSYLPMLWQRADPKTLEEKNRRERTAGREPWSPLTEQLFEDFLTAEIADGKVNEAKIMSKVNMHGLADNFPVEIIRDTVKAILINDVNGLTKYAARAALINGVVDAVMKY